MRYDVFFVRRHEVPDVVETSPHVANVMVSLIDGREAFEAKNSPLRPLLRLLLPLQPRRRLLLTFRRKVKLLLKFDRFQTASRGQTTHEARFLDASLIAGAPALN